MFDLGALLEANQVSIPMLIVMYNNRPTTTTGRSQIHMAHQRGTDPGAGVHRKLDSKDRRRILRTCQRHRLVCEDRSRSGRSAPGGEARHRPSQAASRAGRRHRWVAGRMYKNENSTRSSRRKENCRAGFIPPS